MEMLQGQLREMPVRLERLKKAGVRKLSRIDADSRFLPDRRGSTLGYTATVSEDHLMVAQQISQELTDNALLVPMVERVQRDCGEQPGQGSADSGFFSLHNCKPWKNAESMRMCGTATWPVF